MSEERRPFDVAQFFADLDTIRRYQRMSWRDLAKACGVHSSLLTRLAQGHRPDVDNLCRLLDWSGLSITKYINRPMFDPMFGGPTEER